jgi:hypothetical protein
MMNDKSVTEQPKGITLREFDMTDGTIANFAHTTASFSVADSKRWGARVWRDASKPGGLGRQFLPSREDGKIIIIHELKPGDYFELAHKLDSYSRKNKPAQDYHYFKIIEFLPSKLIVMEVDCQCIPPKDGQKEPTDAQKMHFASDELRRLRDCVSQLESEVAASKEQLSQARNIANRLRRKHNEGTLTETMLAGELTQLSFALKAPRDISSETSNAKGE